MTTQLEIRMNEIIDRYIINSFEKNRYTPESMFQEMLDPTQTGEFIRSELIWWLIADNEVEYDCFDKRNRDPFYDEDREEDAESEEDEDAECYFITLYKVNILEYYQENEKISGEEDLNEEELEKYTRMYISELVDNNKFEEYLINLFENQIEPK